MLLEKLPKTYSVKEVADALNVEREIIIYMGKREEIKVVKIGGRLRVLESSLESYLKEIGLLEKEETNE